MMRVGYQGDSKASVGKGFPLAKEILQRFPSIAGIIIQRVLRAGQRFIVRTAISAAVSNKPRNRGRWRRLIPIRLSSGMDGGNRHRRRG